jgi:transposase-like protein
MARRKRRNHKPEFKAKVALEALKGIKTISQIADDFEIHSNQVTTWKAELRKNIASIFETSKKEEAPDPCEDVEALQAKIGELTMELDWLKKKSKNWSL